MQGTRTPRSIGHFKLAQADHPLTILLGHRAILDLGEGRLRQHDLASVRERGDARRRVDHRADELDTPGHGIAHRPRLPHMNAHAHPKTLKQDPVK
jgi:hypothetical protein